MRPLIAIVLTVILFAGVYGYTSFAEHVRRPPLEIIPEFASGEFAVRISRTFDCEGDPDFDIDSLVIRFRGSEILKRADAIPHNELVEIRPLENVEQKANEIYVAANVKQEEDSWDDEQAVANHAMRIVVFNGDTVVADKTIWLEQGAQTISGTVSFETQVEDADDGHSHN